MPTINPVEYANFRDDFLGPDVPKPLALKTHVLPIKSGGVLQLETAEKSDSVKRGLYSVVFPLSDTKIAKLSHFGFTNPYTNEISHDSSLSKRLVENSGNFKADRQRVVGRLREVITYKNEIHNYLATYIPDCLLTNRGMTIVESPRKALDKIMLRVPEDIDIPAHELSILEVVDKVDFSLSALSVSTLSKVYATPLVKDQLAKFATGALKSFVDGQRMLDISDSNGVKIINKETNESKDTLNTVLLIDILTNEAQDFIPVPKNVGLITREQKTRIVLYDEDPIHDVSNEELYKFAQKVVMCLKVSDYEGIKSLFGDYIAVMETNDHATGPAPTAKVVVHNELSLDNISDYVAVANHLLLLKYLGADFASI